MKKEDLKVLDGGNNKESEAPKVSEPTKKVSRQELAEVIAQLGDNIGQVQEGLVDAVNQMYAAQVFPLQMECTALENLLIAKGIITKEEIDNQVAKQREDILARAKQIKEKGDGTVELASEEEAKVAVNKAIVKANINKE